MRDTQVDASLQAEYIHLQETIEDFDSKALTIKAWSVTFSLAVLVGAFASHAKAVLLVATAASLLFWILETLWKSFQLGYYHRVEQIEAHFRGEKEQPPHQIATAWMERWNATSWREVLSMFLWPHIALPHAAVVGAGLLLFALVPVGWSTL